MADEHMIRLCDLSAGQTATVVKMEGERGFVTRMVSLGFTPGAKVGVLRNGHGGPLIVTVLDTQVALGRSQASQVRVRSV